MKFLTLVVVALIIATALVAAVGGALYVAEEIYSICTPYGSFRLLGQAFTCARN